ncbi:glycosyltransferase [Flavobacterium pectinovorum]|uniref:glycosyltransferase n=1 Tax=Flavobacterium pectinovorum TaxID=29533 RepID=UPI001FAD42E1|nr:glycosyltransferase [Flavobacterium pectinovorum]MCI9843899.1 glycosyltransferase family 1 protein [Flavobacterium pectinovorum]
MIFILKKKILKKIKEFRLNYSYVRFYDQNEPVIYINLNHRTKVRTYLNLFFRIHEVYKEPIVVKFSLLRMFFLAKWFNELDYIYFEKPFSKTTKLKIFSHHKKADFRVNYNYRKIYSSDDYQENALPYIMHPANYLQKESEILPKRIGILMSGNFDEKIYNTNVIQDNFGLHNRWEIYKAVLRSDKLIQITGDELIEGLESGKFKNRFTLMKWQSGAIPTEKWRYYLSSADFIFCAPGMTMPMCHNVLEAMSVGVIPILNYPHWLNPSLENDLNCLVYRDLSEIAEIINKALSLSDDKKNEMAKNVMKYYQMYYENYVFNEKGNRELILLNENIKDLV